MPQRAFWTHQIPSGMSWHYDVDPRVPEDPPAFRFNIYDQGRGSMDSGSVRVPLNVVHEAVGDLLVATWEAYLFGEIGDASSTLKARMKLHRRESAHRPLWG